jgi:hypothetical protein
MPEIKTEKEREHWKDLYSKELQNASSSILITRVLKLRR